MAAIDSVLSYNQGNRQRGALADDLTSYYQKSLSGGGVNDAMRAKWQEMDEGTSAAGAQAMQSAIRPGMFGQGGATRSNQIAQQSVMQQNAANKLKQAQMAGDAASGAVAGAQSWNAALNSQDAADRDFSYRAARDLGDTVTMAGLNQQALAKQGYGYTDAGASQLQEQADLAKSDSDWARRQQREAWDLERESMRIANKNAKGNWFSNSIKAIAPLSGVASAALSKGNPANVINIGGGK